ncbi:fungal-specific transcription factor domain-containing protein [Staphylotrichum tortipilum]|uniref:Fungal-specific transcription factor domain-containing protein n=1 Tax=Staphylotrichum tortipilum TaxID=2831512 RepID=A0AAN6RXL3_9PEZI|nr:fungal-specific transcription factor domain-containing protein [Staphylotrichum longicolle]
MERPKWRISKACQECRAKKIRCDGGEPCARCELHAVECVYRSKARNRARKGAPVAAAHQRHDERVPNRVPQPPVDDDDDHHDQVQDQDQDHGSRGLQNHSVAATHRASPSMLLQLYYGPSSNFSVLNFIDQEIEGTRPNSGHGPQKEVHEMGPGLDRFNLRWLYFGNLGAGVGEAWRMANDTAAMLIDRDLAGRLLERYLATYWHVTPIWPKEEYRRQLARLYVPAEMPASDNPDTIIVMLAMAMGASMLEEEGLAEFLYQRAKQWSARHDEMVNIQTVQIAMLMISFFSALRARPNSGFLMAGIAVRKAVGAGLHKDIAGTTTTCEETRQRRITIWSLFVWEIWLCFSLGRPSSFPESEMRVPLPTEQKLVQSLATLAPIMSKCATLIYKQKHKSLGPIWNAANEIRRELLQFAEQQRKDLNFGLVGDPNAGELGVCQTVMSTMYHHTMVLTFRPFMILRAKLRQERACSGNPAAPGSSSCANLPSPPPWLDKACEYCLEATKHCIAFLAGACEQNVLCREIKYHAFFIEGASHVLVLDLLQGKEAGRATVPWIQRAIHTLRLMQPKSDKSPVRTVDLSDNLERMVRSVYLDFRATPDETSERIPHVGGIPAGGAHSFEANPPQQLAQSHYPYPSTLFGLDAPMSTTMSPSTTFTSSEEVEQQQHADLASADGGTWNFDFATADMEAFLSIDPSMAAYQFPAYHP